MIQEPEIGKTYQIVGIKVVLADKLLVRIRMLLKGIKFASEDRTEFELSYDSPTEALISLENLAQIQEKLIKAGGEITADKLIYQLITEASKASISRSKATDVAPEKVTEDRAFLAFFRSTDQKPAILKLITPMLPHIGAGRVVYDMGVGNAFYPNAIAQERCMLGSPVDTYFFADRTLHAVLDTESALTRLSPEAQPKAIVSYHGDISHPLVKNMIKASDCLGCAFNVLFYVKEHIRAFLEPITGCKNHVLMSVNPPRFSRQLFTPLSIGKSADDAAKAIEERDIVTQVSKQIEGMPGIKAFTAPCPSFLNFGDVSSLLSKISKQSNWSRLHKAGREELFSQDELRMLYLLQFVTRIQLLNPEVDREKALKVLREYVVQHLLDDKWVIWQYLQVIFSETNTRIFGANAKVHAEVGSALIRILELNNYPLYYSAYEGVLTSYKAVYDSLKEVYGIIGRRIAPDATILIAAIEGLEDSSEIQKGIHLEMIMYLFSLGVSYKEMPIVIRRIIELDAADKNMLLKACPDLGKAVVRQIDGKMARRLNLATKLVDENLLYFADVWDEVRDLYVSTIQRSDQVPTLCYAKIEEFEEVIMQPCLNVFKPSPDTPVLRYTRELLALVEEYSFGLLNACAGPDGQDSLINAEGRAYRLIRTQTLCREHAQGLPQKLFGLNTEAIKPQCFVKAMQQQQLALLTYAQAKLALYADMMDRQVVLYQSRDDIPQGGGARDGDRDGDDSGRRAPDGGPHSGGPSSSPDGGSGGAGQGTGGQAPHTFVVSTAGQIVPDQSKSGYNMNMHESFKTFYEVVVGNDVTTAVAKALGEVFARVAQELNEKPNVGLVNTGIYQDKLREVLSSSCILRVEGILPGGSDTIVVSVLSEDSPSKATITLPLGFLEPDRLVWLYVQITVPNRRLLGAIYGTLPKLLDESPLISPLHMAAYSGGEEFYKRTEFLVQRIYNVAGKDFSLNPYKAGFANPLYMACLGWLNNPEAQDPVIRYLEQFAGPFHKQWGYALVKSLSSTDRYTALLTVIRGRTGGLPFSDAELASVSRQMIEAAEAYIATKYGDGKLQEFYGRVREMPHHADIAATSPQPLSGPPPGEEVTPAAPPHGGDTSGGSMVPSVGVVDSSSSVGPSAARAVGQGLPILTVPHRQGIAAAVVLQPSSTPQGMLSIDLPSLGVKYTPNEIAHVLRSMLRASEITNVQVMDPSTVVLDNYTLEDFNKLMDGAIKKLFNAKRLVLPIELRYSKGLDLSHWTFLVFDVQTKTISFLDTENQFHVYERAMKSLLSSSVLHDWQLTDVPLGPQSYADSCGLEGVSAVVAHVINTTAIEPESAAVVQGLTYLDYLVSMLSKISDFNNFYQLQDYVYMQLHNLLNHVLDKGKNNTVLVMDILNQAGSLNVMMPFVPPAPPSKPDDDPKDFGNSVGGSNDGSKPDSGLIGQLEMNGTTYSNVSAIHTL